MTPNDPNRPAARALVEDVTGCLVELHPRKRTEPADDLLTANAGRSLWAARGAVVDGIKLPFDGPVFNLADVALRAGLLCALLFALARAWPRPRDERQPNRT